MLKQRLNSLARVFLGLVTLGLLVVTMMLVLLPLIPWRALRIRVTNWFGRAIGRSIVFWVGSPVTVVGLDNARKGPSIFAGNHTSAVDAFLSIWLTPIGTVGVAKKSILYYPFYGQAWWLAGHLRIDRGDPSKSKASMQAMGDFVRKNDLSVCMWPEGTRSQDGRLLPFKKGLVHLAIQTGLPVVPMVISNAHRAWEKKSLILRSEPIRVEFLPPIDTRGWSVDTIDLHLDAVRREIARHLPEDQRPLDSLAPAATDGDTTSVERPLDVLPLTRPSRPNIAADRRERARPGL